jgi:hypothetical protein
LNNYCINCTYNSEYVEAGSQLFRKWYLEAEVYDGKNNAINSANVFAWNVSNNLQFFVLTESDGRITRQELIEYINDGGTRTHYNNYTVNATKTGYIGSSTSANITENTVLSFILLDIVSPSVILSSPVSGVNYSGSSHTVSFIFDANDNSGMVANCSAYVNGIGYINTSAIVAANNNIVASLSAGNYSAYVNCTDFAGNTGKSLVINFKISSSGSSDEDDSDNSDSSASESPWKTYSVSNNQLAAGYVIGLERYDRIKINMSGNLKFIILDSLNSSNAVLKVVSNLTNFKIGDEKDFDINNDKNYDINIKLNSIASGIAVVSVKKFSSSANTAATLNASSASGVSQKENISQENPADASSSEKDLLLILIIAIIGAIVIVSAMLVVFIMKRIRKNKILKFQRTSYVTVKGGKR